MQPMGTYLARTGVRLTLAGTPVEGGSLFPGHAGETEEQ